MDTEGWLRALTGAAITKLAIRATVRATPHILKIFFFIDFKFSSLSNRYLHVSTKRYETSYLLFSYGDKVIFEAVCEFINSPPSGKITLRAPNMASPPSVL
jgi:hypothetical protein